MNPIQLLRAVLGCTQQRLAEVADTSQPTIAAYESGSKSPTWRTIRRLAESAGLACYPLVTSPMTRDQRRSLALHRAIAARVVGDPASIEIARSNINTMLASNPHAASLLTEWAGILELPVTDIASRMLDPSEHGRALREVTPFAGLLSGRERATVYQSFRSDA